MNEKSNMSRKFQSMVRFIRNASVGLAGLGLLCGAAFAQTPPRTLTYSQGWGLCATEGNNCWFPGLVRDVAYGANGGYIYLLGLKDVAKCTNGEFWDNDPKPGVSKSCYVYNGPSRLVNSKMCAAENGTCTVVGPRTVWYGSNGQFTPKVITQEDTATTSVPCNNSNFGGDPNQGLAKFCVTTP